MMADSCKLPAYAFFDFDHSLINANSDTYIFKQLAQEIYDQIEVLRKEFPVWTDLMDHCLSLLSHKNVTRKQIQNAFKSTPIFNEIHTIIAMLVRAGVKCYILSDANSLFIDYILDAHNLSYAFDKSNIYTNGAYYERISANNNIIDRMRVKYFHTEDHRCSRCPTNLCKGAVIHSILREEGISNINQIRCIYLGDGQGDFCPVTRFNNASQHFIAARTNWALHKLLRDESHLYQANVLTWSSGAEMLAIYKQFLQHINPSEGKSNENFLPNNSVIRDDLADFVPSSEAAFALQHHYLTRLQGNNDIQVTMKKPQYITASEVQLISGGGAGHFPAHSGFVGQNMLTAAVSGNIFASPSSQAILATLLAINQAQKAAFLHNVSNNGIVPSILMIIKRYTGDRINFGVALEEAKLKYNINCSLLVVGDDVSQERNQSLAGRRGIAGTVIVHKLVGGAAAKGFSLSQLEEFGQRTAQSIVSLGMATTSCNIPSNEILPAENRIAGAEYELGLGIHGEEGLEKVEFAPAQQIVARMLKVLLSKEPGRDYFWRECAEAAQAERSSNEKIEVALLVNNLCATTGPELNLVAALAVQQLQRDYNITVSRLYTGTFMTALDMRGFSLSLLRLSHNQQVYNQQLELLDLPTDAAGWTSKGEINSVQNLAIPPMQSLDAHRDASRDSQLIRKVLIDCCSALVEAEGELNHLDTAIGDGDCGSTLKRAAQHIINQINAIDCSNLSKLFESLLYCAQLCGGTSGGIYSILFAKMAQFLQNNAPTSAEEQFKAIVKALEEGITGISQYAGAQANDRTLLDALIPAYSALSSNPATNPQSLIESLSIAAEAAQLGAQNTAQMIPRAGRASYLATRSVLGVVDPGSKAQAILWKALHISMQQFFSSAS
jgi:dihydroxyacetone kinase